jgi:hypothetical protein
VSSRSASRHRGGEIRPHSSLPQVAADHQCHSDDDVEETNIGAVDRADEMIHDRNTSCAGEKHHDAIKPRPRHALRIAKLVVNFRNREAAHRPKHGDQRGQKD